MEISINLHRKLINSFFAVMMCILLFVSNVFYIWVGGYSPFKFNDGYYENEAIGWYRLKVGHNDFFAEFKDAEPADENITNWVNDITPHVKQFIYENYGIEINVPKFLVYHSGSITNSRSVFDSRTRESIICFPTQYLQNNIDNLYSSILHEIFHIFSLVDGKFTNVSDNVEYISIFAEGLTDMFADEFIKWYGLDIPSRMEVSLYAHIVKLIECIRIDMPKEYLAKFYFLHDSILMNSFNDKLFKNARVTKLFNAFEKLDYRLFTANNILVNKLDSHDELLYSLYSSIEIVLYYCKDYSYADKNKCLENIDYIAKFINIHVSLKEEDNFYENIDYLKSIIS